MTRDRSSILRDGIIHLFRGVCCRFDDLAGSRRSSIWPDAWLMVDAVSAGRLHDGVILVGCGGGDW